MRWWVLLWPALALAGQPEFRVERTAVAGGSELLTVFSRLPDDSSEMPLVTVLRDTLGDSNPKNDRLRYVWILTSARPGLLQKGAAALPFFYWRADIGKNPDRVPASVIDLGDTSRNVWSALAGSAAQVMALDPNGALVRSSTRSYRDNILDHQRLQLMQGLATISQLEHVPEKESMLSDQELLAMQARLTLASQTMGGLVSEENLPQAYMKQRTRTSETRGHNWELLRQRAEANGLYFEPLGLNGSSTHALLWIAKEDLGERKFDGQFLGIADPFRDQKLRDWTGYSQIRDGKEMIPLALYGLDYPKVPLLLADFRDTHAPKRREIARRAAADVVTGVLGISRFGNWPYFAGSFTFNFVRVRHGAAYNKNARLKAYSQVRQWMALDQSVDPGLRSELLKHLDQLGVNPLEDSVFNESNIARRQYAALLRFAEDPQGLPARVERDRQQELTAYEHSLGARFGFRVANIASLGIYKHRDTENLEARLGRDRTVARQLRFLETVARSSPQPEVVWNMTEVKQALDDVSGAKLPAKSAALVRRILQQTNDTETRLRAAEILDGAAAQ